MLTPSCRVAAINPRDDTDFSKIGPNVYSDIDLKYSLKLIKNSHVFIIYQFSGQTFGDTSYYFKTRLTINSAVVSQTSSHPSYT